jgi:hypothetical protein
MTPDDRPDRPRDDFFITIALAGSKQLRQELALDETDYRGYAVSAQSDARAYFLYSVLDDVHAAGVALMRWSDLRGEECAQEVAEEEDSKDPTERIMSEMLARESALWQRRLVEALAHLICFSETNEEPFYRHLLLRIELRDRLWQIQDYRKYYGCDSRNLTSGASRIADDIRKLESSIDLGRCWYLKQRAGLGSDPRPDQLLASFASVLNEAVRLATPRERMLLGVSYEGFSETSRLVHFSPGHHHLHAAEEVLRQGILIVSLLTQAILLRVTELASIEPTGICAQLKRVYDQNAEADRLGMSLVAGRARVGDFAVIGRSLARITKVNRTENGYESYEVAFLADAPLSEIASDCVLPKQVKRLMRPEELKEKVRALLIAHGLSEVSEDTLDSSLAESVARAWTLGLRDAVLGRRPPPQT